MLDVLWGRLQQKYRTPDYPDGPALPERFAGRPVVCATSCPTDCRRCVQVCPTGALSISDGEKLIL